jgi:dephospho-CoA kinase
LNIPSRQKNILKIGITGGIGSGKSAVCSFFAHLGVPVLYADEIAKELSSTDSTIRKKLVALLGELAFQTDGSLNRSFIASEIFANKELQKKVESIIHPRVEKEIERQIKELAHRGELIIIVEAALIYEAGLHKKLDAVIVVHADEFVRISRVRKRDVVSEDAVRSRMTAQLDAKTKLEKADYIIYNNGTLEELESKVRFLYIVFKQLAKEGSRV